MIKLQCKCGTMLKLPDKLEGQKVRCKQCGKVLTVPNRRSSGEAAALAAGATRSEDMLLVQGSRTCPGCGSNYPPSIRICVDCGLNLDTGAMLYASLDQTPPPDLVGGSGGSEGGEPGFFARMLRALGLGKK